MRHRTKLVLSSLVFFCSNAIGSTAGAEVRSGQDSSDTGAGNSLPSGSALAPNDGGRAETSSSASSALSSPPSPPSPASPPSAPAAPTAPNSNLSPSSTDAPNAPVAPTAPATNSEVIQVVRGLQGLSTWTVIPFAHFRRGARHVVVAWPAINSSGQLVDATVVGICLEATDAGLVEHGRRWVVRDSAASQAALVQALGGSDYEVVGRDAGIPLASLGPRLGELGSAFSNAIEQGDRDGASRAAAAFTVMLPVERVALENGVAQLLWTAANHNGRLQHVDTLRQGDQAILTFHVMRGRRRFRTIRAQAQRVAGQTDRWIIASYQ